MLTYILFIIGFPVIVKGADFLVEGGASLAKRFNVSDIVIGLTIVAFGTSAPELIVNVYASYKGNAELAIANVLGSNIANVLLALGIAAMIAPLIVKRNTMLKEIPLSVLAAVVIGLAANDVLISGEAASGISRVDGLIMLCFFIIFIVYTITIARIKHEAFAGPLKVYSLAKSLLFIVMGVVGLTMGGDWIVDGAVKMALALGMSQALIGLTIVAVGTSLPEIVTSAVSAYKGKRDIAIGNVVGSNIFNIFLVIAVSAAIRPLPFDAKLNSDILVNLVASGLLFFFLCVNNKWHILRRWHGFVFVLIYAGYIVYSVMRG